MRTKFFFLYKLPEEEGAYTVRISGIRVSHEYRASDTGFVGAYSMMRLVRESQVGVPGDWWGEEERE